MGDTAQRGPVVMAARMDGAEKAFLVRVGSGFDMDIGSE